MTLPAVRRSMRSNRAQNTKPELMFAEALTSLGFGVLRNVKGLPGTPDAVVPALHLAAFVHGCFWHGCPDHWKVPKTRRVYWVAKVRANRRRDKQARAALESDGWKVFEIWEHDVLNDSVAAALAAIRASRKRAGGT